MPRNVSAFGAEEHLVDDSRRAISRAARQARWKHGTTPVIGLTGGVASGKSAVAALLAERGFTVIDADSVGHEVLDLPDVQAEARRSLRARVLVEHGPARAAEPARRSASPGGHRLSPIRRLGAPWRRSFIP